MTRGKNIAIGTVVGLAAGVLYYWLVWDVLMYNLFSFQTTGDNWYVPVFVYVLCVGFGIHFGLEFGYGCKDHWENFLYILIAAAYITLLTALLVVAIWVVTNPFTQVLLLAGIAVALAPAARILVFVLFPRN